MTHVRRYTDGDVGAIGPGVATFDCLTSSTSVRLSTTSHLVEAGAHQTACGRGGCSTVLLVTARPEDVSCAFCRRTHAFKRSKT